RRQELGNGRGTRRPGETACLLTALWRRKMQAGNLCLGVSQTVIPRESRDPVRCGFSVNHRRLWHTGRPVVGKRKRRRPSDGYGRAMTAVKAAHALSA